MKRKLISLACMLGAVGLSFTAGLWSRPEVGSSHSITEAGVPARAPERIGGSAVRPAGATERRIPTKVAPMVAAARDDVLTQHALGKELSDLFAEQVRDEIWAPAVEGFFRPEIAQFFSVLLPEATELSVECRESLCKIDFLVPADRADLGFSRQQALPLGEVLQPWDEALDDGSGRVRIGLYVAFGPGMRSPDRIAEYYREQYRGRFPSSRDDLLAYFKRVDAERAKALAE